MVGVLCLGGYFICSFEEPHGALGVCATGTDVFVWSPVAVSWDVFVCSPVEPVLKVISVWVPCVCAVGVSYPFL